jgi:hypothetical protein
MAIRSVNILIVVFTRINNKTGLFWNIFHQEGFSQCGPWVRPSCPPHR